MVQEAMAELDMDVFSKHIGPYFSWLESKIETGWQQSDAIPKDVLKEVRSVATTMRARFILGVSRDDFSKEVERALDVLELACEAFPHESDEIEIKMQALASGIAEKIGNDLVPSKYRAKSVSMAEVPKPALEKPKMVEPKVEKLEKPKTERVVEKVKRVAKLAVKVAPTMQVKPAKVTVKPVAKRASKVKPVKVAKQEKPKAVVQKKEKAESKKRSFLSRAFRRFIYGEKP